MSIDKMPGLYDEESVRGWQLLKALFSFIVCGIVLAWLLFHWPKPPDHLVKTGVQVEGRVYEVGTRKNGQEFISYGFSANGSSISIKERRVADLGGVQRLGPIPVWYNPADPNDCITPNELRGRSATSPVWIVLGIVVVMALLALTIGLTFVRKSPSLL